MVDKELIEVCKLTLMALGVAGGSLIISNLSDYFNSKKELEERSAIDEYDAKEFANSKLLRIYDEGWFEVNVEGLGKRLAYEKFLDGN